MKNRIIITSLAFLSLAGIGLNTVTMAHMERDNKAHAEYVEKTGKQLSGLQDELSGTKKTLDAVSKKATKANSDNSSQQTQINNTINELGK